MFDASYASTLRRREPEANRLGPSTSTPGRRGCMRILVCSPSRRFELRGSAADETAIQIAPPRPGPEALRRLFDQALTGVEVRASGAAKGLSAHGPSIIFRCCFLSGGDFRGAEFLRLLHLAHTEGLRAGWLKEIGCEGYQGYQVQRPRWGSEDLKELTAPQIPTILLRPPAADRSHNASEWMSLKSWFRCVSSAWRSPYLRLRDLV
jgi:hypothetical protein